jgi:hypothetical protein
MRSPLFLASTLGLFFLLPPGAALAQPTAGDNFPEPIVQWGVQKGDTCESIAKILYGSTQHAALVQRYNRVACGQGAALAEGMTLVLPASVTKLPDARLRSLRPDVRVRPGGGSWSPAAPGAPLYTNYNVNTLDKARADIEFIDRTRIFLASNTLVVIYGTANRTRVSKTPPPAVELDAGEIKAGLAALRGGGSVDIAVKGGGSISASSRDSVIERKGERTTVAVFDGKANVTSGGKNIAVPEKFGTRFVGAAPPIPPRPLPPPPVWEQGGSGAVVLGSPEGGLLSGAWKPEPSAVQYRFEIARDPDFRDLVVREEVPATVLSMRAEKMPPGTYYLSVRAIDKEEYLGIASPARVVRVVPVKVDGGSLGSGVIEASPYAVLAFQPDPGVEMALDEEPFGPMSPGIDLLRRAPKVVRWRVKGGGGEEIAVPVRYVKAAARIEAALEGSDVRARVAFEGLDGISVADRVGPVLRVHGLEGARAVPLALSTAGAPAGEAKFPFPEGVERARIDVLDRRGAVLGTTELAVPVPPPPVVPPPPPPPPRIGISAPLLTLAPGPSLVWWRPTPENAFAVSAAATGSKEQRAGDLSVRASGVLGHVGRSGRVGVDASFGYAFAGDTPGGSAAWLGGQVRALRLEASALELGLALRAGIPVAGDEPTRLEPALAVGGSLGEVTWLGNAGARVRLSGSAGPSGVPQAQAFAMLGATFDLAAWLRTHAEVDGSLFFDEAAKSPGAAGVTVGIEAGKSFFGGVSVRVSPHNEAGTRGATGQIAVGFREE